MRRRTLPNRIGPVAYRLGLDDATLARATGLSRAHLNRIKNGHVIPRVDTALAIAAVLGTTVRRLFVPASGTHAR